MDLQGSIGCGVLSEISPHFGTTTPPFGGIATQKVRENGCGDLSGTLSEARNVKTWDLLKFEGDLGGGDTILL